MNSEIRAPNGLQVLEEDISLEKTRAYTCVVYPDSCAPGWRDIIKGWHIPFLVSPLHQGTNPDGSLIKAHWHVVLFFSGNKTPGQVMELVSIFKGVVPNKKSEFMVQNINGMCRYLYHGDDPDKIKYRQQDVEVYGPIDYESLCLSDRDTSNMLIDITMYVYRHKTRSFIQFMMFCAAQKKEWWDCVTKKNSFYVKSIIQSNAEDLQAVENTKVAE